MSNQVNIEEQLRAFGKRVPRGYRWLLEQNLVGLSPFSQLQPWYYLSAEEIFRVTDRWPKASVKELLIAFARKQDEDILACFQFETGAEDSTGILIVNAWTIDGYEVLQHFDTVWEWLHSVIDDIAEWTDLSS